jgi:hypothetical protein
MGWTLKQTSVSVRFSKNVRDYLTEKFDAGEKSGTNKDKM